MDQPLLPEEVKHTLGCDVVVWDLCSNTCCLSHGECLAFVAPSQCLPPLHQDLGRQKGVQLIAEHATVVVLPQNMGLHVRALPLWVILGEYHTGAVCWGAWLTPTLWAHPWLSTAALHRGAADITSRAAGQEECVSAQPKFAVPSKQCLQVLRFLGKVLLIIRQGIHQCLPLHSAFCIGGVEVVVEKRCALPKVPGALWTSGVVHQPVAFFGHQLLIVQTHGTINDTFVLFIVGNVVALNHVRV